MTVTNYTKYGFNIQKVQGTIENPSTADLVRADYWNNFTESFLKLAKEKESVLGTGEDGRGLIASISNPSTAPSTQLDGSGNITGSSITYKYTLANISGETIPSNASTSLDCSGGKKVKITVPWVSENTWGKYNLYRSSDGSNYYYAGSIPYTDSNETSRQLIDNLGVLDTTLTAPSSNTTSATSCTISGAYNLKSLTLNNGQTINVASSGNFMGKLLIRCTGKVTLNSGSVIDGNGKFYTVGLPAASKGIYRVSSTNYGYPTGTNGGKLHADLLSSYMTGRIDNPFIRNQQGAVWNGIYPDASGWLSATGYMAGGSIYIIADEIVVNGTISANGYSGTYGNAGAAGGRVELWSYSYLDLSSSTISANGGTGNANMTSTSAGGGGGGVVILCSPVIKTTSASISSYGGTGNYYGTPTAYNAGGGHAGRGGQSSSTTINGGAGTTLYIRTLPDSKLLEGLI